MRIIIEMRGVSDGGKEPSPYTEVGSVPDWVKLALLDGSPASVRHVYSDKSYVEYRLRKV